LSSQVHLFGAGGTPFCSVVDSFVGQVDPFISYSDPFWTVSRLSPRNVEPDQI